ncbi:MAG: polyprenyl synthetase family protein, partial [Thermoplasmata archaeon]
AVAPVDFAELSTFRPRIEAAVRAHYRAAYPGAPVSVREYLRLGQDLSLRGGKRFRSLLVLAGFHISKGRDPSPAIEVAAGLEHFQTWMLIHDDIIDHSAVRRGGPTVHRAAAALHLGKGGTGNASDFGEGIAITLGDVEEPCVVDTFLRARVPLPARLAALHEYAEMTRQTAYGQLLDIRNGSLDPSRVSEADVLRVHELKSAIYTVASPLKIGAVLAGSSPGQLKELDQFGRQIGIAFQLRDDVLGAGFDAGDAGKSSNDLVEGKRTLLVVRAWAKSDPGEQQRISFVLGNPSASEADVEAVRSIIRSTRSLEYSEKAIARLTRRALSRLEASRALRPPAKRLIREIATRLVERRT